jgi:predicted permease
VSAIVASLVPIFLTIALGFFVKRINFPGEAFWPLLERVTYFVLFPPFLFEAIASADLTKYDVAPMALALFSAMLAIGAIVAVTRHLFRFSGPEYTSVFQGAVRWNSFVAVAAIASVFGPSGLALASVGLGVLVPVANVMSVYVLTRHAAHEKPNIERIAISLATNPLLIACALGILVNATGLPLPAPLLSTAEMLGAASVPLGLLLVGASLDLNAARSSGLAIGYTCLLRLAVMPSIMVAVCAAWGVGGLARDVAVICGSTPTAASAFILARQLGGDAPLMANLITATTIGAAFTMPLVLAFLL